MNIYITTGKGHGKTLLSAFDTALFDAGVSNYNLIFLSSIIPPGSKVIVKKFKTDPKEYGHRLYVVQAEIRSREAGEYIGASVGWFQVEDGSGVFVEHKRIGETEENVKADLSEDVHRSIFDLCHNRNFPYEERKVNFETSIIKVENSPASALVTAVFQSEPWA